MLDQKNLECDGDSTWSHRSVDLQSERIVPKSHYSNPTDTFPSTPKSAATRSPDRIGSGGWEVPVVTTGTCHPPLPIQAGDFCAVDFGVLGKVSVGFA